MEATSRIILPLDVSSKREALDIVQRFKPFGCIFKVGLQLFTAHGPDGVNDIQREGVRVMLDLKLHDIPETMRLATQQIAKLAPWAFTVHAQAHDEALQKVDGERGQSLMLGVTVLTSHTDRQALDVFGARADAKVPYFAHLLSGFKNAGIVCSPLELEQIKRNPRLHHLTTVVPGVRPAGTSKNDQARIMTPGEAVRAGADYLVIGRPILAHIDQIGMLKRVVDEITEALAAKEASS